MKFQPVFTAPGIITTYTRIEKTIPDVSRGITAKLSYIVITVKSIIAASAAVLLRLFSTNHSKGITPSGMLVVVTQQMIYCVSPIHKCLILSITTAC